MTTLIIRNDSTQSRQFLEFACTLPYIDVVEEGIAPERKLKPSVIRSIRRSMHGKDLIECENAEDMFGQLGI